ncbi:MAG: V-type ATPase 116kDa subunit family protein [Hungatella sp.]|jgi:Glu-tRNA(Gln) amidotransferase subunit E-like FAD-binding protein|nr:V-type ATPase 116kDa subunit family protein [Hungatella sp.]MCI9502231.1 V-type ATPase 116kDa subunit family protein [Hungatella sp.]MCI9636439.1 V-type ATPase 116kDa subunit family protein [Hungatella sp.]
MERRHRRTRREKLEDELVKTEEAIVQYTEAIATMEERRQSLMEEIESEHMREVTKLLKEKNLSVEQLKDLLGDMTSEDLARQGA